MRFKDIVTLKPDNTGQYKRVLHRNNEEDRISLDTGLVPLKTSERIIPKPISLGLIPPGLLWLSSNHRSLIFQRPPCYQTISVVTDHEREVSEFRIVLPWTIYATSLDPAYRILTIHIYGSQDRIKTGVEPLFLLPLSNYYMDGHFCLPYPDTELLNKKAKAGEAVSIHDIMNITYDIIWNSIFNSDLVDPMYKYLHQTSLWNSAYGEILTSRNRNPEFDYTTPIPFSDIFKTYEKLSAEKPHEIFQPDNILYPEWTEEQVNIHQLFMYLSSIRRFQDFYTFTSTIHQSLTAIDQHEADDADVPTI